MSQATCPNCGGIVKNDGTLAGQTVACPFCSGSFVMPPAPASGTAETMAQYTSPPNPVPTAPAGGATAAAIAPQTGRGFECPYCHTHDLPAVRTQMSTAGLIVLIVLLFTCPPLFWIGFFIKDEYRVCSHCGIKVGP
ncbi:MAG: LITAF-like zinc ribbon domain-containing protein [Planctomycetia bacterium]|nr:LITAF-like zinc ribbon domain-containing protein [Planctomycetia bacterium]